MEGGGGKAVRMKESACVEMGGKIADYGDLANLSVQSKQCVLLWSNRIRLLLSLSRLTNKHTCTIYESPAGPQNCHDMHTKHTCATPKAAAKVAVLNQTG